MSATVHKEKSQPQRAIDPRYTFYRRDHELFAQLMVYTFHGTTWIATPCCYCGDPAQAEDHVLPMAAFTKLLAVGRTEISHDMLRLVPSCHECNNLVGDKVFKTFEEKHRYIKNALTYRYHKALNYPQWTPDEIAELSGRLRDYVVQGQGLRDLIFERLRF